MLYSMCMAFIYEKLLYMCMPYNWVIFGEEVWDSTSPSIPQKHWWTLLYPKPWSNPIKASHMQLAYSKSFFPGRHLQPNQYFCWMTLLQHLRLTDRPIYVPDKLKLKLKQARQSSFQEHQQSQACKLHGTSSSAIFSPHPPPLPLTTIFYSYSSSLASLFMRKCTVKWIAFPSSSSHCSPSKFLTLVSFPSSKSWPSHVSPMR